MIDFFSNTTNDIYVKPSMGLMNRLLVIICSALIGGITALATYQIFFLNPTPLLNNEQISATTPSISLNEQGIAEVQLAGRVPLPIAKSLIDNKKDVQSVNTDELELKNNSHTITEDLVNTTQLPKVTTPIKTKTANVSEEEYNQLIADFQQALKDVEYERALNKPFSSEMDSSTDITTNHPTISDLPQRLRQQLPEFKIFAHVYATLPEHRWLNINGLELQQGDTYAEALKIVEIRPRDVLFSFSGKQFIVPAVY